MRLKKWVWINQSYPLILGEGQQQWTMIQFRTFVSGPIQDLHHPVPSFFSPVEVEWKTRDSAHTHKILEAAQSRTSPELWELSPIRKENTVDGTKCTITRAITARVITASRISASVILTQKERVQSLTHGVLGRNIMLASEKGALYPGKIWSFS